MTLKKFIKTHDGTKVGSGQCVALARLWIAELEGSADGFDSMPRVASAKDFWTSAPKASWTKVRRKGSTLPPAGALVIFDPTDGNEHGHVGIALGTTGPTADTFETFDQNFGVKLRARLEAHRFAGVRGWLVFKPPAN